MRTLLIGGVRSGKSALALRLAARSARPVVVIATAERIDADMDDRIDRHRAERPDHWTTIEEPLDLARALGSVAADTTVIVDCMTVWWANLMHHVADPAERERMATSFATALGARRGTTIVVTNEVGMGVHPETEMGREYRDELGRANQCVAFAVDEVLLCVAGRTLRLDPPLPQTDLNDTP